MLKRKKIINKILLFFSLFLIILPLWVNKTFGFLSMEEVLFTIFSKTEKANIDLVYKFIWFFISYISIIIIVYYISLYINKNNNKLFVHIKLKNKEWKLKLLPINIKEIFEKKYVTILFFMFSCLFILYRFDIYSYIYNNNVTTTLYEERYVNPNDVNIVFPEEKRNLIYIYLESMETTYSNFRGNNLINNLVEIADNNIYFSSNNSFGGLYQSELTSWTVASMVGHTSGVPLNIPIDGNSYGKNGSFLPGITTLGNILDDNGYNQVLMVGSEADFGGRKTYYEGNGNYEIFDYYKARELKKIDDDYFVFWGYEDAKLFEFAKEKLGELKNKQPFNFSMLTVDTHFFDGYVDDSCELKYDIPYSNAISCSDSKIGEFVNWIKKQDFYENTTIILVGDHLTMNYDLLKDYEDRKIYNAIINSPIDAVNTKNRIATVLDFFPTTLASLNVKIEGDRLGLGVNLFSNEKTIPEEIGIDEFNKELTKKSIYYNKFIKK